MILSIQIVCFQTSLFFLFASLISFLVASHRIAPNCFAEVARFFQLYGSMKKFFD